ncbi:hypothetical protein N9M16_02370 [Candidatus Dependentiae bacterium]|nr:hypothetical protein [Candidatus Dependentiae bacterium]
MGRTGATKVRHTSSFDSIRPQRSIDRNIRFPPPRPAYHPRQHRTTTHVPTTHVPSLAVHSRTEASRGVRPRAGRYYDGDVRSHSPIIRARRPARTHARAPHPQGGRITHRYGRPRRVKLHHPRLTTQAYAAARG